MLGAQLRASALAQVSTCPVGVPSGGAGKSATVPRETVWVSVTVAIVLQGPGRIASTKSLLNESCCLK